MRLDRGYDSGAVHDRLCDAGIDQFEIRRRSTLVARVKKPEP